MQKEYIGIDLSIILFDNTDVVTSSTIDGLGNVGDNLLDFDSIFRSN